MTKLEIKVRTEQIVKISKSKTKEIQKKTGWSVNKAIRFLMRKELESAKQLVNEERK